MKNSILAPSRVFIFGAALLVAGSSHAQVAPPQVTPTVATAQIVASGSTLNVPVSSNESKVRLRLRNGAGYLDEENKKSDGNAVAVRLDAEPGLYLLRAFTPGKDGRLAGPPLSLVVPGLRREAGVWLFNGSIWIAKAAPPTAPLASARPTFLPDLKRGGKTKLPVADATPQLLNWLTAPVELPAPGAVAATPADAFGGIGGTAVGYSLAARGEMENSAENLRALGQNQALILEVDAAADPLLAARQLDNAARAADALVLKFDGAKPFVSQLWPLKMARRMAEETENFDLPIFADVSAGNLSDAQLLEIYQNGATGFLSAPAAPAPAWVNAWNANSNWLSGAVTLEDMGVLNVNSPRLEPLLAALRAGGRVPLVGQLPNDKRPKGESNMILLDDSMTATTLDGVKTAATAGNTVYLEGLPAPALYGKIGEITGTKVTALPAPREDVLTLSDPWTWGAINGREFPITQRASIEIKTSLAAQTKEEKGLSIETAPRPTGQLTGDANGWMVCPVGKGRVFWMPQSFNPAVKRSDLNEYYAAVAGGMQSALVELDGDRDNVRVALRATSGQGATTGQSGLLGLFNAGDKAATVTVGVRGDATYVVDLLSDENISNSVVGYETKFEIAIPAQGYRWLALAPTAQALDEERKVKRVKARLK